MVRSFVIPISKFEQRELSVKSYDEETGFIMFNFHIPQAIDINLDITPQEIEWLYNKAKEFKEMYAEAAKKG